MRRELVTFLRGEADQCGLDRTAFVNRHLDGLRTWYGLPEAAAATLEADREALGMDRYQYLLHLLFQRSLRILEEGVGFDAPAARTGATTARLTPRRPGPVVGAHVASRSPRPD
jgi:hypothetical protein